LKKKTLSIIVLSIVLILIIFNTPKYVNASPDTYLVKVKITELTILVAGIPEEDNSDPDPYVIVSIGGLKSKTPITNNVGRDRHATNSEGMTAAFTFIGALPPGGRVYARDYDPWWELKSDDSLTWGDFNLEVPANKGDKTSGTRTCLSDRARLSFEWEVKNEGITPEEEELPPGMPPSPTTLVITILQDLFSSGYRGYVVRDFKRETLKVTLKVIVNPGFPDAVTIQEQLPEGCAFITSDYPVNVVSETIDGQIIQNLLWIVSSNVTINYHVSEDFTGTKGEDPHFAGFLKPEPRIMTMGWAAPSYGVGGIVVPVDKFGLLAPYIGLASTVTVAAVATVIYVKRVKRGKEKQ
jgi:hypothetical protein